MKRLLVSGLLLFMTFHSSAADRARRRAEDQLERLTVWVEAMQADPVRRVPAEILREAKGILLIRQTQAGLILGAKGGAGVAMLKVDGSWGPPVFFRSRQGGIGLQAGWQKATLAHVLMTDPAVESLRTNQFRFGLDLRVTSGPRTLGDEAKTRSAGSDILVYADSGGLYGGLSFEAGTLTPDDDLNRSVHGATANVLLQPSSSHERSSKVGDALKAVLEGIPSAARPH